MSKWVRDISPYDFLDWAVKNKEDFAELWEGCNWLDYVEDAESNDFFGTEGFDKRFGGG